VREQLPMAASQNSSPSSSSNGSNPFGNFGQRQAAAPVQLVKIPEVDIQVCQSLPQIVSHCVHATLRPCR